MWIGPLQLYRKNPLKRRVPATDLGSIPHEKLMSTKMFTRDAYLFFVAFKLCIKRQATLFELSICEEYPIIIVVFMTMFSEWLFINLKLGNSIEI